MTFSAESSSVQAERLAALQREVPAGGALLAADQANVRFAAGVSSMAETVYRDTPCWAVVAADAIRLIVASMEVPSLARLDIVEPYGRFLVHEAGVIDSRLDRATTRAEIVARVLEQLEVDGPLIADSALSAADALELKAAGVGVEVDGVPFERARERKDAHALAALRRANRVAEDAVLEVFAGARPGDSERDLARRVAAGIVSAGGWPMLHVVGFGERSALPEAWPSERQLGAGDIVRVDIGCMVDGWHADISRTALCGSSPWAEQAYAAILEGELAGINAAGPGIPVADVFATAVSATREAGLPEFDSTHCGHGIGLSVYEGFLVSPDDATTLQPGHVLCVETPHYDLRHGGVQVEDAILITETGAQRLGQASSELFRIKA